MTRYYAETPCEHEKMWRHYVGLNREELCRGGSRVEVKPIQPDYKVASAAYRQAWVQWWASEGKWSDPEGAEARTIRAAVDAALAGGVLVEVE